MTRTDALRKVLRYLQANPSLCRAVALELQWVREADHLDQSAQRDALAKTAAAAVTVLVEKLAGIEASIVRIRSGDHQRARLYYLNAAVHRNGKLTWRTPGEELNG